MTREQFRWIGDEIEIDGFKLTCTTEHDNDRGAPWDEECGHGPVSDWTLRDKLPGELVLSTDRGAKRYYDFAEACRIALRDGWDAKPYNTGNETKRQQAAKAARADYERLRQWCEDQWHWCGVIVTASREGIELGSASLWGWGIESDADDYLVETANELIDEALTEAKATVGRLAA